MDNIAYLNYISSKSKSSAKKPFILKKSVVIAIISVIALIIIIPIISSISNAIANQETDFTPRLYIRVENLNKILNNYRKKIKSSSLRAETVQLIATTSSMTKDLPTFYPSKNLLPSIVTEEQEIYNKTVTALEKGRVNDNFDRVFARYMDYYTSITLSLSDYVIKHSSDEELKSCLEKHNSAISSKQQYFSDFIGVY